MFTRPSWIYLHISYQGETVSKFSFYIFFEPIYTLPPSKSMLFWKSRSRLVDDYKNPLKQFSCGPLRPTYVGRHSCYTPSLWRDGELLLTSCVCLGLLRLHYAPLQWYMGYLCTSRGQYAPPRRNMHHGAQGRLCFLKNSGDPDNGIWGTCAPSGRNMPHGAQGRLYFLKNSGDPEVAWVGLWKLFHGDVFVLAFHVCESKGGLYVNVKLHFLTPLPTLDLGQIPS